MYICIYRINLLNMVIVQFTDAYNAKVQAVDLESFDVVGFHHGFGPHISYMYANVLRILCILCKRTFLANKQILSRKYVYLSRRSHVKLFCQIFQPPKKNTFANSELNFRGVSFRNHGGLCNGQSLHGPLDRQSYPLYIYFFFH